MSEEIDIDGLKEYKKLESLPEDVLKIRRRSRYDKVIIDAKTSPVKLSFDSEKRATSVYLALRARITKNKEKLSMRKVANDVYVFPSKSTRE